MYHWITAGEIQDGEVIFLKRLRLWKLVLLNESMQLDKFIYFYWLFLLSDLYQYIESFKIIHREWDLKYLSILRVLLDILN